MKDKAVFGLVAVVDRREHRAEIERGTVRIPMVLADHRRDEIGRISAYRVHLTAPSKLVGVGTDDREEADFGCVGIG